MLGSREHGHRMTFTQFKNHTQIKFDTFLCLVAQRKGMVIKMKLQSTPPTHRPASNAAWEALYEKGSSRYANEGDIGIYYRLPKFVEMFRKQFSSLEGMKILEVGGGIGEMFDNLTKSFKGETFTYTITEYSENAVTALKEKYSGMSSVSIAHADAQALPFEDNAFDLVLAFDVMHHVENPRKMAQELMRVSQRYIFMCEACGLSLVRKAVELTRASKEKGERSYTPHRLREFFRESRSVDIIPFYFFVPPKIKKRFMRPFVVISEIGQRIPVLRWQSQSMAVYITLNKKEEEHELC